MIVRVGDEGTRTSTWKSTKYEVFEDDGTTPYLVLSWDESNQELTTSEFEFYVDLDINAQTNHVRKVASHDEWINIELFHAEDQDPVGLALLILAKQVEYLARLRGQFRKHIREIDRFTKKLGVVE